MSPRTAASQAQTAALAALLTSQGESLLVCDCRKRMFHMQALKKHFLAHFIRMSFGRESGQLSLSLYVPQETLVLRPVGGERAASGLPLHVRSLAEQVRGV